MLLIRRPQYALISQRLAAEGVETLARQLHLEYPQQLDSADLARRQAQLTMERAVPARIDSPGTILELARLLMRFGDELAEFPDPAMARQVLAHAELPGALKIEFLQRRLRPHVDIADEEA